MKDECVGFDLIVIPAPPQADCFQAGIHQLALPQKEDLLLRTCRVALIPFLTEWSLLSFQRSRNPLLCPLIHGGRHGKTRPAKKEVL